MTSTHDNNRNAHLVCAYKVVKRALVSAGCEAELKWQSTRTLNALCEQGFLREAAWVIFSSGMRESVIRQKFSDISFAFCSWISADAITNNATLCYKNAMVLFNHSGKVSAIIEIARRISVYGFSYIIDRLRICPIDFLLEFPYLGPATARHLAKNIGISIAKPDRHLQRVASALGYHSVALMCQAIADSVADDVALVDLVIWRFATLDKNYLQFFGMVRDHCQRLAMAYT